MAQRTKKKITHEMAKKYPERYKILDSGAIYGLKEGHIVANPGGGKTAITHATSGELRTLWTEKKTLAKLRGIARGARVKVSDIDADLLGSATSAVEILTAHMARTFLQSSNLRGMGETYTKLLDESNKDSDVPGTGNNVALVEAIRDILAFVAEKNEREIIDG